MNQNPVLVGKKVATSKKDNKSKYYTYYFQIPYTDYELDNYEVYGTAVSVEDCRKDFPGINIGDEVKLCYGKGFGGAAVLDDIILVQKAPFGNDKKK